MSNPRNAGPDKTGPGNTGPGGSADKDRINAFHKDADRKASASREAPGSKPGFDQAASGGYARSAPPPSGDSIDIGKRKAGAGPRATPPTTDSKRLKAFNGEGIDYNPLRHGLKLWWHGVHKGDGFYYAAPEKTNPRDIWSKVASEQQIKLLLERAVNAGWQNIRIWDGKNPDGPSSKLAKQIIASGQLDHVFAKAGFRPAVTTALPESAPDWAGVLYKAFGHSAALRREEQAAEKARKQAVRASRSLGFS